MGPNSYLTSYSIPHPIAMQFERQKLKKNDCLKFLSFELHFQKIETTEMGPNSYLTSYSIPHPRAMQFERQKLKKNDCLKFLSYELHFL